MIRVSALSVAAAVALAMTPVAASSARPPGETPTLNDVAGPAAAAKDETVVYVARSFITMDPKRPRAEAVVVKEGRFVAIGTRAEAIAAAGPGARVDTRLSDRTVIAGFVEQHVHPVLAALTMATQVISIEDWDTIDGPSPAVRDPKGYDRRLRDAVAAFRTRSRADRPAAFVTWGYHHYMHGDTMSRARLNALAPDFPVVVWHRSAHEFFLNDAALAAVGIDRAFFDALPAAARAQADWERGHFFEQGALAIMGRLAPLMATPELFRKGLQFTREAYHRAGITLAAEPGGFVSKVVQDAIDAVYSDDSTPFNHLFMADGKTLALANRGDPEKLIAASDALRTWGRGRTSYLPKQVKLFTDGAIFSQLMMMRDGYTDGHEGAWIIDPPRFAEAFQTYWEAGWQIHVHNNGDGGLDVLLGELEKAMARNPRTDHRTVLVHFGFARPEQIRRWIELGGLVSSNPYYVTALAGRYGRLGMTEAWAQNMVPHGPVLAAGGSLSFHSDMPMAPAKPMLLVWSAVNRLTYEGRVVGPQHRVPLDAALKAITIEAARSIRQEARVGSIEIGKDANLTVLDADPYLVPAARLKDIGVWGTMLEGRMQPVSRQAVARPVPRAAAASARADGAASRPSPVADAATDARTAFWTRVRLQTARHAQALGACRTGDGMRERLTAAIADRLAAERDGAMDRVAVAYQGR